MPAPKETPAKRIARLENIAVAHDVSIQVLIEQTSRLAEQSRRLIEQARRTDKRLAQLREESNEREKRMDVRIERLVSGMGEFLTRRRDEYERDREERGRQLDQKIGELFGLIRAFGPKKE